MNNDEYVWDNISLKKKSYHYRPNYTNKKTWNFMLNNNLAAYPHPCLENKANTNTVFADMLSSSSGGGQQVVEHSQPTRLKITHTRTNDSTAFAHLNHTIAT